MIFRSEEEMDNYHKRRWIVYEQEYILPCFEWAKEIGIDLRQLVADNPGRNCVNVLVHTLIERIKDNERSLQDYQI